MNKFTNWQKHKTTKWTLETKNSNSPNDPEQKIENFVAWKKSGEKSFLNAVKLCSDVKSCHDIGRCNVCPHVLWYLKTEHGDCSAETKINSFPMSWVKENTVSWLIKLKILFKCESRPLKAIFNLGHSRPLFHFVFSIQLTVCWWLDLNCKSFVWWSMW